MSHFFRKKNDDEENMKNHNNDKDRMLEGEDDLNMENMGETKDILKETSLSSHLDEGGVGSITIKRSCVECEDQTAEVRCTVCEEDFCRPCFDSQHRRGSRRKHRCIPILGEVMSNPNLPTINPETDVYHGEGDGDGWIKLETLHKTLRMSGEGRGYGLPVMPQINKYDHPSSSRSVR